MPLKLGDYPLAKATDGNPKVGTAIQTESTTAWLRLEPYLDLS
jgi:hypothetical protein